MDGPVYFFNQPWYSSCYRKNTHQRYLLGDRPDALDHLIIRVSPATVPGSTEPFIRKNGEERFLYSVFPHVVAFWEYLDLWPADRQNFFEVIPGARRQKPHFDIDVNDSHMKKYPGQDIDRVAQTILARVIEGSLAIFHTWKLNTILSEQLLIYSSHGQDTTEKKGKRSFHVIWHGYCHIDNLEARAFYDAVVIWITEHYGKDYLELSDHRVYSSLQNFRLLGSSKAGTGRIKTFHSEIDLGEYHIRHSYRDPNALNSPQLQALTDLKESLISDCSDCDLLPELLAKTAGYKLSYEQSEITEAEGEECMAMMRQKFAELQLPAPFTIRAVKANMLLLIRSAPSWCPVCDNLIEPHQKDHPYIYVSRHCAWWSCRRHPENRALRLGYLASRLSLAGSTDGLHSVPLAEEVWEVNWGPGLDNPEVVDLPQPSSVLSPIAASAVIHPIIPPLTAVVVQRERSPTRQERVKAMISQYHEQKVEQKAQTHYHSLSSLLGGATVSLTPTKVDPKIPLEYHGGAMLPLPTIMPEVPGPLPTSTIVSLGPRRKRR
jgi:hypothetical protein